MRVTVLADVLDCFLRGDITGLRRWLSDGAHGAVAAAIRQRKADGLVMDPKVQIYTVDSHPLFAPAFARDTFLSACLSVYLSLCFALGRGLCRSLLCATWK